MTSVLIKGITYSIVDKRTPRELQDRYAGIAERMRNQGVDYQLELVNPNYPKSTVIAYQKGTEVFWEID